MCGGSLDAQDPGLASRNNRLLIEQIELSATIERWQRTFLEETHRCSSALLAFSPQCLTVRFPCKNHTPLLAHKDVSRDLHSVDLAKLQQKLERMGKLRDEMSEIALKSAGQVRATTTACLQRVRNAQQVTNKRKRRDAFGREDDARVFYGVAVWSTVSDLLDDLQGLPLLSS